MAEVKEITVEEKLKALYELQKIDSKIDAINTLKGELPMEVADLEDEIVGLETRHQKLRDEIKEIEDAVSKRRQSIKDAEALIDKYEKQQNNVKNNREFTALTKELEDQKLDIQLHERKIKDSFAETEEVKSQITEVQQRIEVKRKELDNKRLELEKIQKETEEEEADLMKQSKKAAAKIEERYLKAYHRIRENFQNGLGVVKIERNSCGGCYNKVPPQTQSEIKQRRKIIVCENCGRILVDNEIDTTEE